MKRAEYRYFFMYIAVGLSTSHIHDEEHYRMVLKAMNRAQFKLSHRKYVRFLDEITGVIDGY